MNTASRYRSLSHLILAVFLCSLAVAATTRPLARTHLGARAHVNQVNPRLDRNTYFEVSADLTPSRVIYAPGVRSDLPLIAPVLTQTFALTTRSLHSENWQIAFCGIYRRVRPLKAGDPDPSA
jgi:hypothetical protein